MTGTLGILSIAAERGLLDLADAFARIKRTSFHYRQETMDQLIADAAAEIPGQLNALRGL